MLPFVPIASLLIELDARTNFLACSTHAGGRKSAQSVELKRNILAVLIAGATNLGLTRMSEACGVSYDTLAWTQEWYEDLITEYYGKAIGDRSARCWILTRTTRHLCWFRPFGLLSGSGAKLVGHQERYLLN
jgi:hypothetical protein